MPSTLRRILVASIALIATFWTAAAQAGLSGENVAIVVNADSRDSRTVANHYAHLRNVPAGNLIYLQDVPTGLRTSLNDFRDKILKPVLEEINKRQLASHIRVIAYSVDFPTTVNNPEHTAKLTDPDQKKYQLPSGSINGMTYLYRFVLTDDPAYMSWGINLYARGPFERNFMNPFGDVENRQRFDDAMTRFDGDDAAGAAKTWTELANEFPTIAPLWILATRAHVKAGDNAAATQSLINALRGGWNSQTYLRQTPDFAEIIKNPAISTAIDRLSDAPLSMQNPVGFGGDRAWTGSGYPVAADGPGIAYLMSCVLGVKHERGSTVPQIIENLTRSAGADWKEPAGKFGFSKTSDVRTTTRVPAFPAALGRLLSIGKTPHIFATSLPADGDTYAGLMLGAAVMDVRGGRFKIAPGAICENLTSTGAMFDEPNQSKCTELLNAGAAMSSGAVTEPFTVPFKWPLPVMQAYYAEGVTAIEAFYLTVASPYQLLIVGDPVCQPFAKPPNESIVADKAVDPTTQQTVVQIRKVVSSVAKSPVSASRMEVFLEGRLVQTLAATDTINMRLTDDSSGSIDLRIALIARDATEPRVTLLRNIRLDGPHPAPAITLEPTGDDAGNDSVVVAKLRCPDASGIEVEVWGQVAGRIDNEVGSIAIDRKIYGDGPLHLRAVADFGGTRVRGDFVIAP